MSGEDILGLVVAIAVFLYLGIAFFREGASS